MSKLPTLPKFNPDADYLTDPSVDDVPPSFWEPVFDHGIAYHPQDVAKSFRAPFMRMLRGDSSGCDWVSRARYTFYHVGDVPLGPPSPAHADFPVTLGELIDRLNGGYAMTEFRSLRSLHPAVREKVLNSYCDHREGIQKVLDSTFYSLKNMNAHRGQNGLLYTNFSLYLFHKMRAGCEKLGIPMSELKYRKDFSFPYADLGEVYESLSLIYLPWA